MWLKSATFQKLGGGMLERAGIGFVSKVQLLALGGHKDPEVVRLIRTIRRQRTSLITAFEAYLVYSLARAQSDRPGAFAEVGVYQGGSAKLISEAKGDKVFHLFDTFEGLPGATEADRGIHRQQQYACSLDSVQTYLDGYENLFFHKGLFPESAAGLEEPAYAFVHIDVDLYESTRGCLEYFYSRLSPGGILLSHDYSMLAGVRKAFGEFFADKPERVIEMPTTQCMVVKL
jgi:hypothetical protein